MLVASTEILSSALNKITGIVDRKNSRPILNNCLFQSDNDKLWIYATDLEVSAKICIKIVSSKSLKFCINLKQLSEILRELPKGEVEIIYEEANSLLHLKCADASFSILTADVKEYPSLSFEHANFNIVFSPQEILKIVDKVSYAMSQDETRIFLNGVFIHQTENCLKAVAIDGHRLALIELTGHSYNSPILNTGILIPKKGISELKRVASEALSSNESINCYIDQNFLTVQFRTDEVSIRLISREYPKYQTVIPSKCSLIVKLNKDAFLAAVKRVRLLSNEQTQGIKLQLKSGLLELNSSHSSLGKAFEKIKVEYDGAETEISLNGRYLVDALNSIDSNSLTIEFNNSQSPLVIKTKDDPSTLSIIMPLRL
jgi:DNA polymerase-3 subunit beta